MSWPKRILITLAAAAALILIPVVGLVIYDFYERMQVALFYRAHSMLRTMHELPDQSYETRLQGMTNILLKRLPIGSARSDALGVLSDEGMKCSPGTGSTARTMLVCGVTSPRVRWHIEIQLDENNKVSGGRVLTLKA